MNELSNENKVPVQPEGGQRPKVNGHPIVAQTAPTVEKEKEPVA